MRNITLLGFFIIFNTVILRGNNLVIQHEYLVRLRSEHCLIPIKERIKDIEVELLNKKQSIYLLRFPLNYTPETETNYLSSNRDIIYFNPNKLAQSRSCKPNDPEYSKQWNMTFMGFEDLWCFDRGGISPLGDTIVIGVIDFGFNYTIPDLNSNIYRNYKEIPNNKFDDDQNDYEDDYLGYNAIADSGDKHSTLENHGTNILSLIGAKGNNNDLMTGVNQEIKMMLCSARNDAQLVKCYSYFIKMREDYNFSNGTNGAYVVATSLSLGFDKDFPEQHQALCGIYDLLGSVGILNVCATINEGQNIETYGDIPGLCPSDNLIVVTNTDRSDTKVADAGYSNKSVDIAAPGESIIVLSASDSMTQVASGCSLSAPEIGGAIAYLNQYCEKFAQISKTNPPLAVKLMKEFVISGSMDNASLKGITTSGKRFSAYGAFQKILAYCNVLSDQNDLDIQNTLVDQNELIYKLKFNKLGPYTIGIYNLLGQLIKQDKYVYDGDSASNFRTSVKELIPGHYFLVYKNEQDLIAKKFVKID
ncbi:MAG: S8 family peptidase [Saprospiraceae bacterium]